MLTCRCIVIFHLLVTSLTVSSQEKYDVRKFQEILIGEWNGQAVHTPVGPAPYDINFQWLSKDCISGTAYNGFSHHTWTFCVEGKNLKLDFLSDFRGNDQPIHFKPISEKDGVITFIADTHQFMEVLVAMNKEDGLIKVIHNGKLHVQINLER